MMYKRDRSEIFLSILHFCLKPTLMTRMCQKLGLHHIRAKGLCGELIELDLLRKNVVVKKCRRNRRSLSDKPRTYSRTYYETTQKGVEFLRKFSQLPNLVTERVWSPLDGGIITPKNQTAKNEGGKGR